MDSTLREFKLFHSIMVKVKKEFLKTVFVRREMLCTFQVKYNECFARIKLRDVWDSHFPRPYENGKVF